MKDTGLIRKCDELGRIVIPKEIRKSLGIKDGDDLEIYTLDDGICLKKYSRLLSFFDLASFLCSCANETMGQKIIITDMDKVIASFSSLVVGSELPSLMNDVLLNRSCYTSLESETFFSLSGYFHVCPIIVSGDVLGLIILFSENRLLSYMMDFTSFLQKIFVNKIDIL